jgi:hypothetical protein
MNIVTLLVKVYKYFTDRKNEISFKGILYALLFSRKSKLYRADILLFCHDNSRTTKVNNLLFAPIIDPIIEILDNKATHITFAGPFSVHFGKKCFGNVVMYNRSLLFAYIFRIIKFRKNKVLNLIDDPVINFWERVLEIVEPKIILGINPPVELCLAAKNKNIWVADIQHGIISYGNYYDENKRKEINQLGWPDAILCWDEFSKSFVENNFSNFVKAFVIGNTSFYTASLNSSKSKYVFDNSVPSILVTLQYAHTDVGANDETFQQIGIQSSLLNFILEHGNRYNWYLRLHPAVLNNRKNVIFKKFDSIFNNSPNVDWVVCNSMHLHAVLQECNAHVTFNSASVRDASLFGIKSAVLDNDEIRVRGYFADLFAQNLVSIESPESIYTFNEWIINCFKDKKDYIKIENNPIQNIDIILSKLSDARGGK